ncbi:MAG: hypothetical protein K2N07_10805 [Desulfovibrio sp.]|nr:hypothetical protein [Desulfovibrio sp.]
MDKTFRRMARSFLVHDISVDRITWIPGIGMDARDVREYLKENVLFGDEKYLKNLFGDEIGTFLHETLEEDGDGVDCALDELLRLDGWLVEVSCREPDPKTVKFDGPRGKSWLSQPFLTTRIIYHQSLITAFCKALLWGARLKRNAFRAARARQENDARTGRG